MGKGTSALYVIAGVLGIMCLAGGCSKKEEKALNAGATAGKEEAAASGRADEKEDPAAAPVMFNSAGQTQ